MKHTGNYSSHDINFYDVDHVINDVNKKVNEIINNADWDEKYDNGRLIILAVIDRMTEKLRQLK